MDDRHVDHESVVIERDSGVGMGVVLGVILAIVLVLTVMWFAFGANMMRGGTAGGSQSNPSNAPGINVTVPQPDVNITVPKPDVNITVPNEQPVGPSKP